MPLELILVSGVVFPPLQHHYSRLATPGQCAFPARPELGKRIGDDDLVDDPCISSLCFWKDPKVNTHRIDLVVKSCPHKLSHTSQVRFFEKAACDSTGALCDKSFSWKPSDPILPRQRDLLPELDGK